MHTPHLCAPVHRALRLVVLLAASVPMLPPALAADANAPVFTPSTRMKQYHIHYDVNADGTYTETHEIAQTILNDMGVQMSRHMPLGMRPLLPSVAGKQELEVTNAYTLKKDGQKIPAAQPPQPKSAPVPAPPGSPVFVPPPMLAFQNAEVGDDLVTAYKITQKEAPLPGNILLRQMFAKFVAYDDVEVSVSAPASMNLRFDVSGAENKGTIASAGNAKTWVWKFQNKNPQVFVPGAVPTDPIVVHITSFKDDAAEQEATAMQMQSHSPRCAVFPGIPNDGPDGMREYEHQIASWFWNSDAALANAADEWNIPSCVLDDGRPRLTALSHGIDQAIAYASDWDKTRARIEELKQKYPGKAFVAVAEARYWTRYAWDARGSGYASSVTPDGWRLFHERLEKAEKVLLDSKPYASSLPLWYDEMLDVQSALSRPAEERHATFNEGAKKYKTDYWLYFTMGNYLLPKWGGSWDMVDSFAQWSVENTRDVDGTSMYARIYWSAYQGLRPEESLFKDTRASWPKMKKGFEDLMARHPKSKWNLNNFAKFACLAGDRKTFRALRKQIGKDAIDQAWDRNPSLDLCEAKYGAS